MQGTIAQILCLTSHGNSFLAGNSLDEYFPDNTTFKFCKYVKFVDLESDGSGWKEKTYADTPLEWLNKIQGEGVFQLRAWHYGSKQEGISDRMSVGFVGGGGRWLIECVKPAESDFWEGRWEVGDKDDPDQNIWNVTYGRIAKNARQEEIHLPSVSHLTTELRAVLGEIYSFANKNGCENFGVCFANGINALSVEPNEAKGYRISPAGYLKKEADQLINACQAAWVFGGMGSWNDLGFNDEAINKQYEELSERLFNLINISLVAAVNSSFNGAPRKTLDAAERKKLKKIGKELIQQSSQENLKKLRDRNPFPITDPRWAKNLKEEYYKNRKFRQNKTKVLIAADVIKDAYIEVIDTDISEGLVPMPDWYLHCLKCQSLVPTDTTCDNSCSCGAVVFIPEIKFLQLPPKEEFQIVKLIGKGSILPDNSKKPWWKFW